MFLRSLSVLASLLLLSSCAGGPEVGSGSATSRWNGEVDVYGALRAMFHDGQIGSAVALGQLVPNPRLCAVGALAELEGEITVIDGQVYLSYPEGDGSRTEVADVSDAHAALLAVADVPAWQTLEIRSAIGFRQLDDRIAELAAEAGLDVDGRFPFLIEGVVEDLRWHVIDGARLDGGGSSHGDHLAASVQARLARTPATLVGFYSPSEPGVITHMGSRTHVHCVVDDPLASGHVDHVVIPAGATVRFPSN